SGPRKDDICYATQNPPAAVKALAEACDLALVVGSPTSPHSHPMRELAERLRARATLMGCDPHTAPARLEGRGRLGPTARGSAPEVLVQEVLDRLQALGAEAPVELAGITENITFTLPRELRWV